MRSRGSFSQARFLITPRRTSLAFAGSAKPRKADAMAGCRGRPCSSVSVVAVDAVVVARPPISATRLQRAVPQPAAAAAVAVGAIGQRHTDEGAAEVVPVPDNSCRGKVRPAHEARGRER